LLLLSSADPVGDPAVVWRAAASLGIPTSTADVVEANALLTLSPRVVFPHPLFRSAVYGAASPDERREAHRALAEATEPDTDPDRRAWHRAQATAVPDEDIALELERSAARALTRGGFSAAAAFLERSAALSLDSSRRSSRALAAAQAKFQAGALDDALELLAGVELDIADDQALAAQGSLLRGRIAFAARRGHDAAPQLLSAARALEGVDPVLARSTYLEALAAAMYAGRLAQGEDLVSVSEAALAGSPLPATPGSSDLLLQGLAVQCTKGYALAAPLLKEALAAFAAEDRRTPQPNSLVFLASWVALHMWDDASWEDISRRQLTRVRQTGDLSILPFVLDNLGGVSAFRGQLAAAQSFSEEARVMTEATGVATFAYCRLAIAALRGREVEFAELIRTIVDRATAWGEGNALTMAEFLRGTLYNGLGRYDATLAAVTPNEFPYVGGAAIWALTEVIEAAVRCDERERAEAAFTLVEESTQSAGTDWALGIEARSRALLSSGDDADDLYKNAIEHLDRTSIRVQLARTHLLYGEWLRRERRRLDAREELRIAYELFKDFGVETFADRAARELSATGERARKRSVTTLDQLTPQESLIARLASQGATNREIALRLFISDSTVEYHLHKVFRKLNVRSRTELAGRFA
jgi:DNA-binding CsgD family transcriptional regulator